MRRLCGLVLALALLAGCDAVGPLAAPGASDTGLEGRVLRGPIQPVCHDSAPCDDEPFAAGFTVRRGDRRVGTFRTGHDGRFSVRLAPGAYTVVPDADAPLLAPTQQSQSATVGGSGVTVADLHFDTGIR